MSIEAAFLRDVIEHPDDETPRLAYADWLTDRGDPQGEFIAVQCELARGIADERRRQRLEDRERALLREYELAWAGPLLCRLTEESFELGKSSWSGSWRFRRGFVEAVELAASQMVEHGPILGQQHPIRELTLAFVNRDPPDQEWLARRLAGLAMLERVTTLTLLGSLFPDESRLTDAVLGRLLASPHLGRLRRLRLQDCSASFPHMLETLQALPASNALEQLEFDHYLQDSDLTALAASPLLRHIRQLELWLDIDATPDGLRTLLTSPYLVSLQRLHAVNLITGSRMEREGVAILAAAPALAGLESLELNRLGLTAEGLRSLFTSPHLGRLRRLNLADNPQLGNEGVQVLADLTCLDGLAELNLARTLLNDPGLAALAAAPFFPRLTQLDLSCNPLRPASVARLDRLDRVESLDLSETFVGAEGVRALAAAPYLARLRHLGLSGVRPGEAVAALVGGGRLGCLRRLDLSGTWCKSRFGDHRSEHHLNGLGDTTAFALAGNPGLARLTELELGSNTITDVGAAALANAPHLAGLEVLGLENNLLSDAGARALAQSAALAGLKTLRLGFNAIRDWSSLQHRFGRRLQID